MLKIIITFKKCDRRGKYPSCSRFPKICPRCTVLDINYIKALLIKALLQDKD